MAAPTTRGLLKAGMKQSLMNVFSSKREIQSNPKYYISGLYDMCSPCLIQTLKILNIQEKKRDDERKKRKTVDKNSVL